jgi:hypothetical protein
MAHNSIWRDWTRVDCVDSYCHWCHDIIKSDLSAIERDKMIFSMSYSVRVIWIYDGSSFVQLTRGFGLWRIVESEWFFDIRNRCLSTKTVIFRWSSDGQPFLQIGWNLNMLSGKGMSHGWTFRFDGTRQNVSEGEPHACPSSEHMSSNHRFEQGYSWKIHCQDTQGSDKMLKQRIATHNVANLGQKREESSVVAHDGCLSCSVWCVLASIQAYCREKVCQWPSGALVHLTCTSSLLTRESSLVSLIENGFIFAVYGSDPNGDSSWAIDVEIASAIRETPCQDSSHRNGGKSIVCARNDVSAQFALTSRTFEGLLKCN